ncbi:GTPase-activating protein-like protein of the rho/rac family, partial [Aureobasidium melanogenum]
MGLPTDPSTQHDADDHPYPSDIALPPSRTNTFDSPGESPSRTSTDAESQLELASRHRPKRSLDAKDDRPSDAQVSPSRDRSRPNGKQSNRICAKCGGHLTGQFVRALGGTYHLECFTCHDCGKVVASKFFPVPEQPPNQYPLCETDYFRRLDLLCHACGGALRGSYITALDRKYHIEHFTCSVCPTVFGAQDSYYEHEGNVYCHYHYSTKFAQRCNGCQTAILKQFVEIFRNGQNQHWHPECYMIHKYWNVRLHQGGSVDEPLDSEENATEEMRKMVKESEESVEEKVLWIWRTLSSFEEKSATCISDMLLHVSNGAYVDGVMTAKKFITHVDLLFSAADNLDQVLQSHTTKGLSYSREAKLLCKKVVAFFQLLAESQETGVRRLGVTQELLSLVTGLAHYLKLLIRICLQGALKLERETGSHEGLTNFLDEIGALDDRLDAEDDKDPRSETENFVARSADNCAICDKSVEDKCFVRKDRRFHAQCLTCSKCSRHLADDHALARWDESSQKLFCDRHAANSSEGDFIFVTRLQQYVHLLRVAHARLLATLRTSGALPHTSDDPNLTDYDSNRGHRVSPKGSMDPPLLRSNTRSKSYAGSTKREHSPSYEQTLGDIRRLRSTRMEKNISTTNRKARTSRVIDGPEGLHGDPEDRFERRQTGNFQIVDDGEAGGSRMSQLQFGNHESMTLDDIPRLVQAQQTREQRPNASKFHRGPMIPQEPRPKLINNGHTRHVSLGNDEKPALVEGGAFKTKKYFSELSALEYFIVRHVAVLSMEPLLEGHFNQEELLDLIETKRPTFWGKFGKAFKPETGKKPKGNKRGIFGVSLEQLVEKDYAESTDGIGPGALRIPVLIQDAISAMRTMDMSVEGVFRKNGNIKRLNDVKEEIDSKEMVDVDLTKENPVQVAALLKKFLRELPDPLMTFKLHKLWITSQKIADEETRRRVLHLTCCLLPKAHRDTMEVLFNFMQWVSSFSHIDEESGSKMDVHNLATVMAPNILHLGKRDVPLDDNLLAIEAVHSLIEYNEYMCEVPEDLALILNDSTLFSASADITTKEILKRYGDRTKGPSTTQGDVAPPPQSTTPKSRESRGSAPVVTRVDTDAEQANAWGNEASVRHVAADMPPQPPFAMHPNKSSESQGSPTRNGNRNSGYAPRPMGVT